MELGSENNPSKKDERMKAKSSFEGSSDTEKSEKKDSKKKNKESVAPLAEDTAEKKQGLFEKPEEKKAEEPSKIEQLFTSDEKPETDEEGPELPENLEELSDEEVEHAIHQILESREEDLAAELHEVPEGSSDEAEVEANALLIKEIEDNLENGASPDEALDAAEESIIEQLEIEPVEAAETEPDTEQSAEPIDADDEDEAEPIQPVNSTGMPAAGGSASVPPPPSIPVHNLYGANGGGAVPGAAPLGPNFMPNPNASVSTPNVVTPKSPERGPKYQRGADLLVGGIIGYFIGRRRGRIKTEERLMPIQKSLETKVRDLNEKISIKEDNIRKLTAEKVAREGEDARQSIAEKVEAKAKAQLDEKDTNKREAVEQVQREREDSRLVESVLAGTVATEAVRTVSQHEVETTQTTEVSSVQTAKETVAQMSDSEVLQAADKVEVQGQSAKELYEQGRLSREDLRAVVIEKLSPSGSAERKLVEKLKTPKSSETGEVLKKEAGGTTDLGAATPAIWKQSQSAADNSPKLPEPIERAVENRLAQDRLESGRKTSRAPVVAGTILVVLASLILAAFVF